jgi:hypothetical protein
METSKKTIEWHVSKQEWQEEAVHDHLTCCLCGTELKFEHKVDHVNRIATEDASCTACGIKQRSASHPLQ